MIDVKCSKCDADAKLMINMPSPFTNLRYVNIEGHLWWRKYYLYRVCGKCREVEKIYISKWDALIYDSEMKYKE